MSNRHETFFPSSPASGAHSDQLNATAKNLPSRTMTADGMSDMATRVALKCAALVEVSQHLARPSLRPLSHREIRQFSGMSPEEILSWAERYKTMPSVHGSQVRMTPRPGLTVPEMHQMMRHYGSLPSRPPGTRAIRIGVYNFKGGTTKSTTTLHLATYFALRGWRTLAIDADPQGSLSAVLGAALESGASEQTLLKAFKAAGSKEQMAALQLQPVKTRFDRLDLLPATLDLIGGDAEVASLFLDRAPAAERFYECVDLAIASVESNYDIILIDGAPAFSFASLAVMWATDGMVIPLPPSSPDFRATAAFLAMAGSGLKSLARRAGIPDRSWSPVLFLNSRARTVGQASAVISALAEEAFGKYGSEVTIPELAAIPNVLARHMSVWEVGGADVPHKSLAVAKQAYGRLGLLLEGEIQKWWARFLAKEAREDG